MAMLTVRKPRNYLFEKKNLMSVSKVRKPGKTVYSKNFVRARVKGKDILGDSLLTMI